MTDAEQESPTLSIPRLYTGDDGRSHWGEMELDFTMFVSLNARVARSGPLKAGPITFRWADADCFQDFHPAPRRQFVITLQGEAEYETTGGEIRRFGPGGIFLAEDTEGEGHSARGLGSQRRLSCYIPLIDE